MSDVLEVILKRRSVRAFKPDPIPEETLRLLLESACWAGSAGNLQPWKFIVVTQGSLKGSLAGAASQPFLSQAPVIVVVIALPEQAATVYGNRGRELYAIQDTASAAQNLLLAATSLELGSCWVGAFDEQKVKSLLKLGPDQRPVVMIPLGQPAEHPEPTERRPLSEVVTWM